MSTPSLSQQLDSLTAGVSERGQTRRIVVGDDALDRLAAEASPGPKIVICDPNTRVAAGDALLARLEAAELRVIEPQPGHDDLVCDTEIIAKTRSMLADAPDATPIAVGAGTINDIVKKASAEVERDYLVVPTAASMNGYTSSIAAILADGVKRTIAAQQPAGIYVPLSIVAAAPAYLNRAGFGDLLSKPFSNADWLLSHHVRGVPYDAAPAALLDDAYNALLDHAEDVSTGAPEGVQLLTETLLVSGFSMAMAGTSAPASGGEHLISHYWDMEQHCQHAPLRGLHGTQVGIATRLSAMLYERLVTLDVSAINSARAAERRPDASWIDGLGAEHPALTPEVLAEVQEQLRIKQTHGAELAEELARLEAVWPELAPELAKSALSSARITQALREAGCVFKASELGVERSHLVRTLRVCRQIRSRYVALDLMDDLGLLDGWAAEVAAESEESS